jgi:hypothetical protein
MYSIYGVANAGGVCSKSIVLSISTHKNTVIDLVKVAASKDKTDNLITYTFCGTLLDLSTST